MSLASEAVESLRQALAEGEWGSDDRLPPETELARRFGVGRATIREAVAILEHDGLLRRHQGSGTFVMRDAAAARNNLNVNTGVTELISSACWTPGTIEFRAQTLAASSEESEALGLEPETSVLVLQRVRTADGRRVVFARDVIPFAPFSGRAITPHAVETVIRSTESLYTALDSLGVAVHHAEAELRPTVADAMLAERLAIEPGALLMHLHQIDYLEDGSPILYSDEYHVADAFSMRVYRVGPRL